MKIPISILALLVSITGVAAPSRAAEDTTARFSSPAGASVQLSSQEILRVCVRNQAQTLPNPFTDVSPDHWAYKAVLTLYYCGPYREATPRSWLEQPMPETEES